MINVGRRIPRNWFKRTMDAASGLITFQTNLWIMIEQSLRLAKRKATIADNGVKIIIKKEYENEDLHYQLEWLNVIITGNEKQELEEYNEAMTMYSSFKNLLKKDIPKDERMSRHLKTTMLNDVKVEDAYKKGYGALGNESVANKLLEMGIMTRIELIKDYDARVLNQ